MSLREMFKDIIGSDLIAAVRWIREPQTEVKDFHSRPHELRAPTMMEVSGKAKLPLSHYSY